MTATRQPRLEVARRIALTARVKNAHLQRRLALAVPRPGYPQHAGQVVGRIDFPAALPGLPLQLLLESFGQILRPLAIGIVLEDPGFIKQPPALNATAREQGL